MIIVVAQQKGGVGKSTLAAHLAVAAAQRSQDQMGEAVALVDSDPQASLYHWYEARQQIAKTRKKPLIPLNFRKLSGWQLESEVKKLAQTNQHVIIDTPPHADTDSRTAIRLADKVVLPLQPSPLDLWAAQSTLQAIAKQARQSLIVLNRVNIRLSAVEALLKQLEEANLTIAQTMLGNRSGFADSMGRGLTLGEVLPKSKGAQEIAQLAQEIFG